MVIVSDMQSVEAGASMDIRPGAGAEWIIKNIKYSGPVSINQVNGANVLQYDTDGSAGARMLISEGVTNTQFIRVTNTGFGTILIAYDGRIVA